MAETDTLFPTADRHQTEIRAISEIERLPGVIAAAVWLRHDLSLREARIHIMTGAAPTIVVNAASRVLQALSVSSDLRDIRTIHVAPPDEGDATGAGIGGRYLLLHGFTLTRTGPHVICQVQLMRYDDVANGEARELDTAAGRVRAAAAATLRAAEQTAPSLALGLEGAVISSMFGREYAVASVEAAIGRRVATLSGMVQVDPARAPEEAVCLAVLRAIDRWIAL
ncbi:MAG TPA: hypothetical protein VK928_05530 [Longimicrobiales bacterium]|nr:hypothetical protein [Longimicrobiales bacterium]